MFVHRFLIVWLALVCLSPSAYALPYSSVVVFGDSLSDNGNLYAATGIPASPPYYQGRRSDGPVAVEYLASALGVPLYDYAWIGATTGAGGYGDGGNVATQVSLPGMTTVYNQVKPGLSPSMLADGLFVVWGGPNDLLAPDPSDGGDPMAIITHAVGNLVSITLKLQAQGAQSILVPGMPDLGLTPDFRAQGVIAAAQASAFTDAFNLALVASLPMGVLYFDTASLLRGMVANPGAFGLENVTNACFNGATVCSNPQKYLFYDGFHPTTAVHAIFGRGFLLAVPEPSTLPLIGLGLALLLWTHRQRVFVSRAKA